MNDDIRFWISFIPLIAYTVQIFFYLISIVKSIEFRQERRRHTFSVKEPPGVSVVKPLLGTDPCLEENLASHFAIQYPKLEILLCVKDPDDPVIELVNRVRSRFSRVDCKLLIGDAHGVPNPMVENMLKGYDAAKYGLIWISTSRIKASTEILEDLVQKSLEPGVAAVHQIPCFTDRDSFAHAVDKICSGCYLSRNYIALNSIGICCFTGMSYVVKKHLLDKLGGLRAYGSFLAEDFFISKHLHERGFKLLLSKFPAQQNVADTSLSLYRSRMVRWIRLRITMIPHVALLMEPLNETLTLGLLTAFALNHLLAWPLLPVFIAHCALWILLDRALLALAQETELAFGWGRYVAAWLVKELLVLVVYVQGAWRCHYIRWGPRTFYVSWGGRCERLGPHKRL